MSGWVGVCEHCKQNVKENGTLLYFLDFWVVVNNRKWLSYHIVCENCLKKRHEWCEGFVPDFCEKCGEWIEAGDHCLEKKYNRRGKEISSDGLDLDESCRLVCPKCYDETIREDQDTS